MGLYCQDNAAYRQFVGHTLLAIKQEIANLDNVDEANIKSGAKILGFIGTYTNEDVADAVTPLDIAEGKVAYVNGQRIVGVAGIMKYTLTVDETGTGTGTGSVTVDGVAYTVPVDYVAGAEVTLVATPDAGSVFVNWTIDGVEVGTETTYTYTMSKANKTIVANFDLE
jgi:hypothetical protein